MVEFAIASTVLSLLLLGTVTLSGYMEVQRRVITGARQVAYASLWSHGRQAVDTPRWHASLFADSAVQHAQTGAPYVSLDDLSVRVTSGEVLGAAANSARLMLSPLRAAGGFAGSGFDLQNDGLMHAQLEARIAPLAGALSPFDALDLPMAATFVVLGDAWQASGADQVRRRAGGLVPGQRLEALSGLWRALLAPVRLLDPSVGQLCLGIVEAERIPEDRLGPGTTPAIGNCP